MSRVKKKRSNKIKRLSLVTMAITRRIVILTFSLNQIMLLNMFNFVKKHNIKISIFGILIIISIFFIYSKSFTKIHTGTIIIKKEPLEVFYNFFTKNNISSWHQGFNKLEIAEKLDRGSKIIFHFPNKKITYEILDLKNPNFVRWKNFNLIEEFEFKKNSVGTAVNFKIFLKGPVAFLFYKFNKNLIEKRLDNTLYFLKQLSEKNTSK